MKILLVVCAVAGAAFGYADNELADFFPMHGETFGREEAREYHGNGHSTSGPKITKGVFATPLNHFDTTDSRVLHLTYHANLAFFEKNAPIYINMYYGQGSIRSGLVHDVARDLNGALIAADTRFMHSNTLKNVTREHYSYYNLEQIIADVPHLVEQVRADLRSPESKVILHGFYKGGTIAVLAKKRFPHLIDGAWSHTAPFFFQAPYGTSLYNGTSWNIHHFGGHQCANTLSTALREIVQMVEKREISKLTRLLNLCPGHTFSHPQDKAAFYETLFRYVAYRADDYIRLERLCRALNVNPDPVTTFARWLNYEWTLGGHCRNMTYASRLQNAIDTGFLHISLCTETGHYFHVTSKNLIYPDVVNKTYYESLCRDVIGDVFSWQKLQFAIDNLNRAHGGRTQLTTNTIISIPGMDTIVDCEVDTAGDGEVVRSFWHDATGEVHSLSPQDSHSLYSAKLKIIAGLRVISGAEDSVRYKEAPRSLEQGHQQQQGA